MIRQIPNLLSCLRILLIPIFVWKYTNANTPQQYFFCGVLLVVSGITDMMDGVIARRWALISNMGKVLDPLADKLTQFAVTITIALKYAWMWPLPVLLAVKDICLCLGGLVLYRKYRQIKGSRWYGKLATVVFYLVTVVLVAFPQTMDARYVWAAVALITGVMMFAGVMYTAENISAIRGKEREY